MRRLYNGNDRICAYFSDYTQLHNSSSFPITHSCLRRRRRRRRRAQLFLCVWPPTTGAFSSS